MMRTLALPRQRPRVVFPPQVTSDARDVEDTLNRTRVSAPRPADAEAAGEGHS
jgi:hypothetical protein